MYVDSRLSVFLRHASLPFIIHRSFLACVLRRLASAETLSLDCLWVFVLLFQDVFDGVRDGDASIDDVSLDPVMFE